MKMKQKQRARSSVRAKQNVKLLIIGGASIALIGIVAFFIFSYLNFGITKTAKAATNITGVINSYLRVTAFNSGLRRFTADNLSGNIADFAVGKTVMIYQVKGATISTSNNSTYGTVSAYNNAGNYEFAVVSARTGTGPYTITFAAIVNSYTVADMVQLISVPVYTDATLTGNVTAVPWSASTGRGGVVAMQVANDLTLGANINVSGQGFAGGIADGSDGDCPDNSTYRSTSDDYGAKGEGITSSAYLYAIGAQVNGGGGGNPHNAGGGGGSNSTYGGNGGQGFQPGGGCVVVNAGGIGGKKIVYSSLTNKVFFGGGGGSGQQNNDEASDGGNGGGIIVIRAKNVKSTCGGTYGFIADGSNAGNSGGGDGAGGGGGGGSIVLDIKNYILTCNITVRANGGSGGNVNHADSHGGGGGAGVGITMETTPTTNARVAIASVIGTNGKDCLTCSTASGTPAESPTTSKIAISSIPGTLAALPIKLLSFTGDVVDDGVALDWSTAMEENNDYFTIERSLDGTTFDSIVSVPGAGNSKTRLDYTTTDKNVFTAITYYRLKQTDYDGKFTYSKIIYVDTHELEKEHVVVYPNPASDILNIVNPKDTPVSIRMTNDQLVVVFEKRDAQRETKLDVSAFKNGMYMLETVSEGKKKSHKIFIQH